MAEVRLTVVKLAPRIPGGLPEAALVRLEGTGMDLAEVRYPPDDTASRAAEVVSSLRPWIERCLRKGLEEAFKADG